MCIFCDIAKGKSPSYKIYEDKYTYAFLAIGDDRYDYHTLVIPKRHTKNILTASKSQIKQVMNTAQKIANHYKDNLNFPGIVMISQSEPEGFQSVMHWHVHVIPKHNDGLTRDDWYHHQFPQNVKLEDAQRILALKSK